MAALAHRIRFRINLRFLLTLIGIYQFVLVTKDYFNFESKHNRYLPSDVEAFGIISKARHYVPHYIFLSYFALIGLFCGVYTERRCFVLPWIFIAAARIVFKLFNLDEITSVAPGDYGFEFTKQLTNYSGSFFVLVILDVFLWIIVLLFLLKSHIRLFPFNLNLKLAAVCTVLIHLGVFSYVFYGNYLIKKIHRNYSVTDYIEPVICNVLVVLVNFFLLLGSFKLNSKLVLMWIVHQICNFIRIFMALIYILNKRLVFYKSGNPFQGAYFTWILNLVIYPILFYWMVIYYQKLKNHKKEVTLILLQKLDGARFTRV